MRFDAAFWSDLEAQFRALPDAMRMTASFADGQWSLGDGPRDERQAEQLRKRFRDLATRAGIATGAANRTSALNQWLDLLREESPCFHAIYLGPPKDQIDEAGYIENVALASAEYCGGRATRAFELEAVVADGGTCPGLRRDRYPFRSWLYDHSHQAVADLQEELDYWTTYVWRGFNNLMAEYERLGIATWPDQLKKLNGAVGGISYDLAVLQVNHLIDRGLRGEEAMRVYLDASAAFQEQLASSWLAWHERLQILVADDNVEVRLARPFLRVAADFQQLLDDLPPLRASKHATDVGDSVQAPSGSGGHDDPALGSTESRIGDALFDQPKTAKRRGRPKKIADDLKQEALRVTGNKRRAQILYQTRYPTSQQVKNVRSILRHYQRRQPLTEG